MPRASERKSPSAQRHADTVRFVLFEARPAGLTFNQLVRSSELSPSQARAGLVCLRDIIAERGWPPLIWTRTDGYKFCSDPAELQAYEVAIIGRNSPKSAGSSPASSPRTRPSSRRAGGSGT